MAKFIDTIDVCEGQGLEAADMAKCVMEGFVNFGYCVEEGLPELSEMDEPEMYGPCTQKCWIAYNDTLINHCDPITNPRDQAQCFFKASATLFACIGACANNTIEYELPVEFSEGCLIDCMLSVEEDINKCGAFEGQEEFKCVTDVMRGFFRCSSGCVPEAAISETLGKRQNEYDYCYLGIEDSKIFLQSNF